MGIGLSAYILASLGLILVLGCYGYVRSRRQRALDAAWEAQHPRAAFDYCGKTLHFYEDSHGNQVEYLDPAGRCYLWYPGNRVVVVGQWRCDESRVYFRYGYNTYNPVTGVIGGRWEPCTIALWSASIIEAVPGDILGLEYRLPFVLEPRPAIRSIRDLAASGRQQ
jgi:hypothetical protein